MRLRPRRIHGVPITAAPLVPALGLVSALGLAPALALGPALGPARAPGQAPRAPGGAEAGGPPVDVYLNDSFDAVDALARADRLVQQQQFADAATLLQGTSDRFGDFLVEVQPDRYVGLRRLVSTRISEWPPAGIAAYRRLFDRVGSRALDEAIRQLELHEQLDVLESYFCLATAPPAADQMALTALERGDVALARRVWQTVLTRHPDRGAYTVDFGGKLAVLDAIAGDADRARAAVATLLAEHPDASIHWLGRHRPLAEAVSEAIEERFQLDTTDAPWPTFQGNYRRDTVPTCPVDQPGLLWRRSFDDEITNGLNRSVADRLTSRLQDADRDRLVSISPIATSSLLIAQRGPQLVALDRASGQVMWQYQDDAIPPPRPEDFDAVAPAWYSPTAHGGSVYAAVTRNAPAYFDLTSEHTASALLCLDAARGELVWRVDEDRYGEALKDITFDTAPVVARGRVYVVARRRRTFDFEDCYLYRFRASDGAFEERTHLGSASTGLSGRGRAAAAIPALSGDCVFVATNLGSVACVSAGNGAVRWLRLYERAENPSRRMTHRELRPWHHNAPILSGDRLIVLPLDSDALLVLGADDGALLNKVEVTAWGPAVTLLGLHRDVLYAAGDKVVAFDLSEMGQVWSAPLPTSGAIGGRGIALNDRLLLPMRNGLSTYRLIDGRRSDAPWDASGRGGNLLALEDALIVAGDDAISAYLPKQTIWRQLQARMAAAPHDAAPALEFAETALRGGDWSEAEEAVIETVRRLDAADGPPDAELAERVFADVLAISEALVERGGISVARLEVLFDLAQRFALTAPDHLKYRLRFAAWFEALAEPQRSVRLYQQILLDRSLRDLPADDRPDGAPADRRARAAIADLIRQHGRQVYATFDAEAEQAVAAAQAAGDEAGLMRLVAAYPNALAAPRAVIARADLHLVAADALTAARLYREAYYGYTELVDRPALIRRIADAYEKAGRLTDAWLWLSKAAREFPSAVIDVGSRRITFREYAARLESVRRQIEPARPRIELPLNRAFTRTFDSDVDLLTPRFADVPSMTWTRFWTFTHDGLRAHDPRTGQDAWDAPHPVHAPPELLLETRESAVLATRFVLFGVDPASGRRLWSVGEPPPELDDEDRDWEHLPAWATFDLAGGLLVGLRRAGELIAVDVGSGEVRWSRRPDPPPDDHVAAGRDYVAYVARGESGKTGICVLDASTGEDVVVLDASALPRIDQLYTTLDGQVLAFASDTVAAFDPDSGRRRWVVETGGRIRNASIQVDVDGLYMSADGRSVIKISLVDGATVWRSPGLTPRRETGLNLTLQDGNLIVTTSMSINALDGVSGQLLWRGTTPDDANFTFRAATAAYVLMVHQAQEGAAEPTMIAYDHRHASGLVPAEGGVLKLEGIVEPRAVAAVEGGLLVQDRQAITGWYSAASAPSGRQGSARP